MSSIGFKKILEAILSSPRNKSFHIGELPDNVLQELSELNPAYTMPNVRTTTHAADQRKIKDGWSNETTAKAFDEFLSSGNVLKGMKNKPGGNRATEEALWLPGNPMSLFAPVSPLQSGGVEIRTLHEDNFKDLMELLESQVGLRGNGALPISSLHRNVSYGGTGSQLPLSAVKGQPEFGLNLQDVFNHVKNSKKSLLPYLLGGGTAGATALASPEDAEAANIGPHGYINLFGTPPTGERRAAPSLLDSVTQAYLPDQTPRAGYGEEGGNTLHYGMINLFGTPPTGERRAAPSLLDSLTQAYLPGEAPMLHGPARSGTWLDAVGMGDSTRRALGLGTRDVLEGLTSFPDGVANAVNSAFGGSPDFFRLGGTMSDWLGLPKDDQQSLSSSIIQGAAGGLPMVPVGLAMQGAGKLPMLANALARYKATDLGLDIGLGAGLSEPAMRWAFGR